MSRSNRIPSIAAIFAGALGLAGLAGAMATPAAAAPLPPVSAVGPDLAGAADDLLTNAQWGPPYGHAYGYRRRHYYDDGPRYYRPHRPYYRPAYRCRTVWTRQWNPYRGYYVSRPVRRCW